MVFTIPHCLNPLILLNRKELLALLFQAVRNTLLSFGGRRWIPGNEDYLLRVQSLAKEFKKQYLTMVRSRLKQQLLPEDSLNFIKQAEKKEWIVYAKKPFTGPEQVLEYLGRYAKQGQMISQGILPIPNTS